jgi:CMP-N-acetylneuraminic acid synthetase/regulator of RNase E activity RraA
MTVVDSSERVVAFLPVKRSSDRVANKNIRPFGGEPFFLFTLRKLLACDAIDEVFIDSECEEILEIGKAAGATPLKRDPALASNDTDGHALFWNEVQQVDADIYVQALCTSPFVRLDTIKSAIKELQDDASIDSVVLGQRQHMYTWSDGRPGYGDDAIPNSSDLPWIDSEGMSLYVVRRDAAMKTHRRIGDRPRMVFGRPLEVIDVDTEADFELAESIAAGLRAAEGKRFRFLSLFLNSAVLSDVLDELGHNGVLLSEFQPNFPDAKTFGRVRPLSIRACEPGESPRSIYEALNSYHDVTSYDVVVIQTDLPEFAYFGELNMALAVRCGAIGAIIGGTTRDSAQTAQAGFPVFSRGTTCRDIKGRGAVRSMNMPIELDGVYIDPGDLVFADRDGVVVIPAAIEDKVLTQAMRTLLSERHIMGDVCSDLDVGDLVDKHGYF